MTNRLPPPTRWVVCPWCNGTKLDPLEPKYICEWCSGKGDVSAASVLAKGNMPMQEVHNLEYKKFVDQPVEWVNGLHPGSGTVEAVYYSPHYKKDIARVRVSDQMAELVDADLLKLKK